MSSDESTLDSYSELFARDAKNFSTSTELNREKADRTFTKAITGTLINAFTGKPISPNPWRKLSTVDETPFSFDRVVFSPLQRSIREEVSTSSSSDHEMKDSTSVQCRAESIQRRSRRYCIFRENVEILR